MLKVACEEATLYHVTFHKLLPQSLNYWFANLLINNVELYKDLLIRVII